jgi:hypothetical protein
MQAENFHDWRIMSNGPDRYGDPRYPEQKSSGGGKGLVIFGVVVGIAGILSLLVAIGAWWWPQSPHDSSNAAVQQDPRRQPTTTPTQGSVAGGGSDATTGDAPEQPTSDRHQRSGKLTLSELHGIRIDTESPNWDVAGSLSPGIDVYFIRSVESGYGSELTLLSEGDSLSYATCDAATDWVGSIRENDLEIGAKFCVKDKDGNYAAMQVTGRQYEHNPMSITVTISSWWS